ncbi:MAG: GIY-YIG nuclease family protein [Patescibacteria group bacterium]
MYHLYILKCSDGTLYTGITVDIERRVMEHNSSRVGAKYTRSRRPVKLVYSKKFRNRSTASRAEFRIKHLSRAGKQKITQRIRSPRFLCKDSWETLKN